jgi:rubrerythrin
MAEARDRSMDMLNTALEKEEFGRQTYQKAIDKCVNEVAREIFKILLVEEGVHISRIKKIYTDLKEGKGWQKEWSEQGETNPDLKKLFQDRASSVDEKVRPDSSDMDALKLGLEFEQGAIEFYQDHLPKAQEPLETEFIKMMIKEEQGHYQALKDMELYFKDPESWYTEKERHVLDGA